MTAPNRVDELRKRYHENPRRFFAPLANEYRKTGFVDRAILLCEKHLGEQPGNMNGLVVYGQCLFETGRMDEARVPFEMALGVDPENLIALRHLGDIARLGGDQATARTWYTKLLEFDRRNEEVSALLAEVGGAQEETRSAPSQAPSIISVAPSVSVAGDDTPSILDLGEDLPRTAPSVPPPASRTAPPPRAATPARPATPPRTATPARAATPPRTAAPVDPSAKTVEVSARPASPPPRRASLLDVSFDFGELGVDDSPAAPQAAAPLLPAEAAEYGFAAPASGSSAEDTIDDVFVEPVSALPAFDEPPSAPPPPPPPPAPPPAPPAPVAQSSTELTMAPMLDASPDEQSLAEMPPIDGLLQADFSSDVAPLADLESTEFAGGTAAPLSGLDAHEFEVPDRDTGSLDGLESAEFTPPSFSSVPASRLSSDIEISSSDAFGGTFGDVPDGPSELPADGLDEPAWPTGLGSVDDAAAPPEEPPPPKTDPRASVAGLPLLEPLGTPTPAATPSVTDLPLLPSLEEAETVQMDVEELRARMETPATFVTETMAKVYVQQGHTDKAIEVYKQLIAQSPDDAGLRARLRALEAPMPPAAAPRPAVPAAPVAAPPAAIAPLETIDLEPIAEAMPIAAEMPQLPTPVPVPVVPAPPARQTFGFETPNSVEPVDEPAPANAMLSAMSFDGVSLNTPNPNLPVAPVPAPSAAPAPPVVTEDPLPPATGPSARDFLRKFMNRSLIPDIPPPEPMSPTAGGRLLSPLDDLFGRSVSAEDEAAAHRLAGVGATSGPSGGTALDSLFGEGPSAPMPSTTPSRGAVPRASDKLRFDQFFASSTPVEGSAATRVPTPIPEPPSVEPHVELIEEHPSAPAPKGEDDDLDQFQGWLRGLTS